MGQDVRGGTAPTGRERELSILTGHAGEAAAGSGHAIVLHGPAGIGKTTLLKALLADARATGWTVLSARGSEAESDVPYGVARALLEEHVTADETLLAGTARHARGALLTADETQAQEDVQHAVLRGLCRVVARMAQSAPTMLAIDDLHWADDATHRFLDALRVRLDGLAVLVVAVVRDGSGVELEHWFADSTVRVLDVPPLRDEAVATLVRRRLPEADDAVCAACVEATGGNPFLLGALADDLSTHSGRARAQDIRALTPEAVVRAVGARLGALGPDAGRLARAAAVLGEPLVVERAARLAGVDAAVAAAAVRSLADAGLLVESDGRLAFPHPLMLAAVRESGGPVERIRLSGRAGRLLADEPGQLDRACAHLLAAAPAGDPAVVRTLVRGAEIAQARGAPAEARALLVRALEEPPPPESFADIACRVLDAAFLAGDPSVPADGRLVLDVATDPSRRLHAAITLGHVATLRGHADEAVRIVRQHLDPAADPELVSAAGGLLVAWGVMVGSARSLLREEVASTLPAARADHASAELLAVAALEAAVRARSAPDVTGFSRRAIAGSELLRRHGTSSPFPVIPVFTLAFAGEYALAEREAETVLAVARDRGSLIGTLCGLGGRGHSRGLRGDIAGAESDLVTALDLGAGGHGFDLVSAWLLSALSRCLRATAGPQAAAAALDRLAPGARSADSMSGACWVAERARVALADGRPSDALADVERLSAFDAVWPSSGVWTQRHVIRAWTLLALGDGAGAAAAAAAALEAARAYGAALPLVDGLRAAAAVTPGPEGDALLDEALVVARGAGLIVDEIEVLLDAGTRTFAAGKEHEARAILTRATAMAEQRGAERLAARARSAAVRAGARPHRAASTGAAALTLAERRVAELAAAGHPNRQIADDLFLAEKTVENHLTSIFRKLGIRSRVEVRDALAG